MISPRDDRTPDGMCVRHDLRALDLADMHLAALEYRKNGRHASGAFNPGIGHGYAADASTFVRGAAERAAVEVK